MIDIKVLRDNPEKVANGARSKNVTIDTQQLLGLDQKVRELLGEAQQIREKKNVLNESFTGRPTEEQQTEGI